MKIIPLILLTSTILLSCLQAEDMQKYRQETVRLTTEGQYEEALERHIWFHNHALEHDPSMTGVRLSFALSDWYQLGKKYPPAMDKLKEIRDDKTQLIIDGKGSFELFHDVSGINRTLNQSERTLELFKKVETNDAILTKRMWFVARDLAFEHEEYELINRHLTNVEQAYRNTYADYLRDLSMFQESNHSKWVRGKFGKETEQLAKLAEFNDDLTVAEKIRSRAAAVLKSADGIID